MTWLLIQTGTILRFCQAWLIHSTVQAVGILYSSDHGEISFTHTCSNILDLLIKISKKRFILVLESKASLK